MENTQLSLQHLDEKIQKYKIQLVRFEMSDLYGISHMKGIPARHFEPKAKDGILFPVGQMSLDPVGTMVEVPSLISRVGYGCDFSFYPDFHTFHIIPWQNRTARVLLRAYHEGIPLSFYPRNIAERQLLELESMGISLLSAHEHEFCVVDGNTGSPVVNDLQARSTIGMVEIQPFMDQLRDQLPEVGIDIETMETEHGRGQYEVTYKPSFGIRSADNALTFKTSIKEIAKQHKLKASFMSKTFPDCLGSGAHFNHSLWNVYGTRSLMYDDSTPTKLSKLAEHWIAGQLHHAPGITVLLSQTLNCFSRLGCNTYAPVFATWGINNRSTLVRVVVDGEKTRLENRLVSAASCPYISLAAIVAAGIDGIKREMELPPVVKKSSYIEENLPPATNRIPLSLSSAIECFLDDAPIRQAMGEQFVQCFLACKENEQKLHDVALAEGKSEQEWAKSYYFEYI